MNVMTNIYNILFLLLSTDPQNGENYEWFPLSYDIVIDLNDIELFEDGQPKQTVRYVVLLTNHLL